MEARPAPRGHLLTFSKRKLSRVCCACQGLRYTGTRLLPSLELTDKGEHVSVLWRSRRLESRTLPRYLSSSLVLVLLPDVWPARTARFCGPWLRKCALPAYANKVSA
eukprot:1139421-Pelagomonas_calceolata.AAC.9